MKRTQFDIVIIGAGSGGLTAAFGLAKTGHSVLLIEAAELGGECTNSGCIPSKALISYAHTYHTVRAARDQNIAEEQGRINAWQYVRSCIQTAQDHESPERLQAASITLCRGTAHFTSPTTITVDQTNYRFKRAIIATGSHPRTIDIPGAEKKDVLTNTTFFDQTTTPERLLIIGAGAIGLELAQAMQLLGSQVTLIEGGERIASREPAEIAEQIHQRLTSDGVRIITEATVTRVENRQALIQTPTATHPIRIPYNKILLAIGRQSNIPAGLSEAGIATDGQWITVDTSWRTTNPRVYAIGDVTSQSTFTHSAEASARQVVTHIISRGILGRQRRRSVPAVTYLQPEVAQVGLTWEQAKLRYGQDSVLHLHIPASTADRALVAGESAGCLIVIIKRLTGRILGAQMMLPQAGELIGYFTLAIDNKWSLPRLARTIYPYPTYSQYIKHANDQFLTHLLAHWRRDLWHLVRKVIPLASILVVWIVLVSLVYAWLGRSGQTDAETTIALLQTITSGVWGPALFIVVYTFRPLLFFPALWLSVLAGTFFGFTFGLSLTIIGAFASALLAYAIGRWFNRSNRIPDITEMASWRRLLQQRTFESILFLRLSFLPFDVISYLAGVLKLRLTPYAIGTLLGILPGTALFVSLGASINLKTLLAEGLTINVINWSYLGLAAVIFIVAVSISALVRRWQGRRMRTLPDNDHKER